MSRFTQERNAFMALQSARATRSDIFDEYIRLVTSASSQYNTAIFENRFVAGGTIEVFTSMLLNAAGVPCALDQWDGGLILKNEKRLEVSSLSNGINKVILCNRAEVSQNMSWETARLFVVSDIGIIYGDPDLVNPNYIVEKPGHLELQKQALKDLEKDSNYVIRLNIPRPHLPDDTSYISRASFAVAKEILENSGGGVLKMPMERI